MDRTFIRHDDEDGQALPWFLVLFQHASTILQMQQAAFEGLTTELAIMRAELDQAHAALACFGVSLDKTAVVEIKRYRKTLQVLPERTCTSCGEDFQPWGPGVKVCRVCRSSRARVAAAASAIKGRGVDDGASSRAEES